VNRENVLINVLDYEEAARQTLPKMVYDFYAGGSDDELTLRANAEAWGRVRLRPRVMVDVSQRDLRTTILGQAASMPILTAPCGLNALAHPDGECAVARAAATAGIIQVVSTPATRSLEEVAAAAAGTRWFQLYCYRERAVTRMLVERAEAAGYVALCVTVDTPRLGRRERDVRNRFGLPPGLSLKNLEQANLHRLDEAKNDSALGKYTTGAFESALTWEMLDWLRGLTRLPIVVKGILTAEDARLAVEHGAAGIIVSNHGGRQLDGAISTCEALPEVAEAAVGRAEVFVDGGIRRGSDVLKALALGARAALIGRPYLWGLAVGGEQGVRAVLEILRGELDLSMALAGRPTIDEIDRTLIA
jgi:isopentenyl diphosphate isomerase/L-lactate dehydrogenase-like FMN-dependent dehydrogenase